MTAVVYTDASYSSRLDVAACGFVLLVDGRIVRHSVTLVEGLGKPSAAEHYAMVEGLQAAYMVRGVTEIKLKTDHKATVELMTKPRLRCKLPKELKETIYMIIDDSILFFAYHVKAHASNKMNNKVDAACRETLYHHTLNVRRKKLSLP